MEIQNISGPDAIPSGLTIERTAPTETENTERRVETRREPAPEENKGGTIDTYA
ncbi:MAG TPA: hypothetical protein PK926_08075 [Spirochaetota bacterium]|nr:hypothetical protein [Spirochaetota bacterium]HPI88534.1 hypothetical protein [Spirochaetota bacterium]HPR48014.1 hypothetical protein [Spirochaetota bacterium]